MNLKLRIKLCFFKHDYEQLKDLIVWNENTIEYLNIKEIKLLFEYAKNNHELILLNTLLNRLSQKELSKEYEELIASYLNAFLPIALENPVFLYSIASMMSKKKEIYKEQIEQIKNYIFSAPLSEIAVYIHTLDGFYEKEIEEKIICEGSPHLIFCLLESANLEDTRRILIKYISLTPSNAKVYRLAGVLNSSGSKLEELISVILGLDLPKKTKSGYLLSVFEGTNYLAASDYMKREVIQLNDFSSVDKLMHKLSPEDQAKWILEYQEKGNKEILLTLACTTNVKETKDVMETFLDTGSNREILILAAFIKINFLPDLLTKLMAKNPQKLLKILDSLYLFGSNRWSDIIDFIIANNKENRLEKEEIDRLQAWKENKQKIAVRKRTLTE